MGKAAIHIVGAGVATPAGSLAASTAAHFAGVSRFREHHFMVDKNGEPMVVAFAADLAHESDIDARILALMSSAIREAMSPLAKVRGGYRIAAVLAFPSDRVITRLPEQWRDIITSTVTKDGLYSEIHRIEAIMVSEGHSIGAAAINLAATMLVEGDADFCLVGGADSYAEPEVLEYLDAKNNLFSCQSRWGFVPGEGSGFLLLTTQSHIELNIAQSKGLILKSAFVDEETGRKVATGKGLSEAINTAIADYTSSKVDQVYVDLNGEAWRADDFGFATCRMRQQLSDYWHFRTTCDTWGDIGVATLVTEVAIACQAAATGFASGPLVLVLGSDEGGGRGAAVLELAVKHRT